MCGGIKINTPKHNMRTTMRLAYHGCKTLTHTSRTRQGKRTPMVATPRLTLACLLLIQTPKNLTQWFPNRPGAQRVYVSWKGNQFLLVSHHLVWLPVQGTGGLPCRSWWVLLLDVFYCTPKILLDQLER